MSFEYAHLYATDEPQERLASAGISLSDYDEAAAGAILAAWKLGCDFGAAAVRQE